MKVALNESKLTAPSARSELRRRAQDLAAKDIVFINHVGFRRLVPETVLQVDSPLHVDEATGARDKRIPTMLSSLFKTPLLTPKGEQHLFRKLNYFRYRANKLRTKLDPSSPKKALVEEIEACLRHVESARKMLVESNVRLVASIARKFRSPTMEFDELLSEGNLVLVVAIDKFDFSRGFRFSTYATHAVQRHLYRVIERKHKKRSREIDTEIDILANTIHAREVEVEDDFPVAIRVKVMRALKNNLDERENQIVTARYGIATGQELTLKEISDRVGLSKERVRQIQHRAVDRLREAAGVSVGSGLPQ